MTNASIVESVLGITDPLDSVDSMERAYLTLTGETRDAVDIYIDLMVGHFEHFPRHDYPARTAWERNAAMAEVDQLLCKDPIATNILQDWPTYHWLLDRYGERAGGQRTSLLVGAYTPLASRALEVLTYEEYGVDRPYVVDLEPGKDKARHGSFLVADGLELPFPDQSMDFVTTNQLLHMLENPSEQDATPTKNTRNLFAEIARVLAPGGQLLMSEIAPGISRDETDETDEADGAKTQAMIKRIGAALTSHGLDAAIGLAHPVVNRNFAFDSERDLRVNELLAYALTVGVYARKDPKRVFALPPGPIPLGPPGGMGN